MTYANHRPITADLLDALYPLLDKHKGKLIVCEYDIITQSWGVGQDLVSGYALIVVVTGAVLGRENWLRYTWSFGHAVSSPTPEQLEAAVIETFKRLALNQVRQLQTLRPPTDPPSTAHN